MNAPLHLVGADLDLAVAMAGEEWKRAHEFFPTMTLDPTFSGARIAELSDRRVCMLQPRNPFRQDPQEYSPSTDWRLGGPIIDREHITLEWREYGVWMGEEQGPHWIARHPGRLNEIGGTPLVAAMRAFVAAKAGGAA